MPNLTRLQFAVGRQTGQLGAGPGAAGRAIVSLAGAQHKVAAVGLRVGGKQLDMVDNAAVFAIYPCALKRLTHRPAKGGQRIQILRINRQMMFADQKKPVTAPGNIAHHRPVAVDLNPDLPAITIGRYVFHRHAAILMQGGIHRAHRSFDQVLADADFPQIGQ
ncbi:hypothetical protein D3C81_1058730 [compost metagenome]